LLVDADEGQGRTRKYVRWLAHRGIKTVGQSAEVIIQTAKQTARSDRSIRDENGAVLEDVRGSGGTTGRRFGYSPAIA
jgi:hypothetical protein